MRNVIRVQPAPELRREFAQWAVDQDPKLTMLGSHEFGVPPHVYTHMPEELLVDALVEGTPYVPADDDEVVGEDPAGPGERAAGGVVRAGALVTVGEEPPGEESPFRRAAASMAMEAGPEMVIDLQPPDRGQALPGAVAGAAQHEPEPEPATGSEAEVGGRQSTPGESLPAVPEGEYGPDAVPIPPSPDEDEQPEDDSFACRAPGCGRTFTTSRGRDAHTRQVHPEQRTES